MSTETSLPRHHALLAEAESLLQQRRCLHALTMFNLAGTAGAAQDRCAAGAWMAHMLMGNYQQAWIESDSIRARNAPDPNRFWQGESLQGRRVMLRCLHGYGDTVQYLRWLPQLRALAAEVTVQAAPEMLSLLACMPEATRTVTWTAPGETDQHPWDVQIESAELPHIFRATPANLPPPARMVFPGTKMHRIRRRMGQRTRPRIGLVWAGSSFDPARSLPFDLLRGTVLQQHAFEFWSLQPPATNVEWLHLCAARGWVGRTFYTTGDNGQPRHDGIVDMAAFASELDLVLTVDTLAAHIAGSLGVAAWLLLKHDADWRWMLDREDTPWYPGMRLFRQHRPGDWKPVLERVCQYLRDWREEHPA